jgi:hypothetical protein
MTPYKFLYLFSSFTIILSLTSPAFSGFEADVVTTLLTEKDGERIKGKIYVEENKSRYEGTGADRGKITIADYDEGRIYFIDKQNELYSEIYYIPDVLRAEREGRIPYGQWYQLKYFAANIKIDRERVREESIEGRPCTVYEIKVKYEGGMQKSTTWEDNELKIPIKSETVTSYGSKVVVEYKNIRTGFIDPSLFNIPKELRKKAPLRPYSPY